MLLSKAAEINASLRTSHVVKKWSQLDMLAAVYSFANGETFLEQQHRVIKLALQIRK